MVLRVAGLFNLDTHKCNPLPDKGTEGQVGHGGLLGNVERTGVSQGLWSIMSGINEDLIRAKG